MRKRPVSVTIIAWIMIVSSASALLTGTINLNDPNVKALMERTPIPMPVQYVMMYAGLLISFISGIAVLKRRNWARFLFAIWGSISIIINFIALPMKALIIPGFVYFLVIVFFLFRPGANEYFTGGSEPV